MYEMLNYNYAYLVQGQFTVRCPQVVKHNIVRQQSYRWIPCILAIYQPYCHYGDKAATMPINGDYTELCDTAQDNMASSNQAPVV